MVYRLMVDGCGEDGLMVMVEMRPPISYLLMAVSLSVLSALDELHKNNTPMYS